MKVARHDVPGKSTEMIRPVGNGVSWAARFTRQVRPIIPCPPGRARWYPIPGTSCLATIIQSLRDIGNTPILKRPHFELEHDFVSLDYEPHHH
jgi:hypothetical protein